MMNKRRKWTDYFQEAIPGEWKYYRGAYESWCELCIDNISLNVSKDHFGYIIARIRYNASTIGYVHGYKAPRVAIRMIELLHKIVDDFLKLPPPEPSTGSHPTPKTPTHRCLEL